MRNSTTKTTTKRGRKQKPINKQQLNRAQFEIVIAHKILRTWDAVARHYGISKAAAHRIANDKIYRPSQVTIDKVLSTARPDIQMIEVFPCPDCLSVHIGRCHNHQVIEVVTLAPGETVRKAKPPRSVHPDIARMVRGLELCLERKGA